MDELEKETEKEIKRIDEVLKVLEVLNQDGKGILELIESYHTDSKHFFKEKKFLQAFEAAVICWAYVDVGLHVGIFKVPEEMKKTFTV
ncbi:MAG: DUF357 domain-containing protein [Candidatus Aenigmatarchaeota archaeon]